ncbi:MAG: hypothetical protein ACRC6V_03910 [Bacteroidales bacterium]
MSEHDNESKSLQLEPVKTFEAVAIEILKEAQSEIPDSDHQISVLQAELSNIRAALSAETVQNRKLSLALNNRTVAVNRLMSLIKNADLALESKSAKVSNELSNAAENKSKFLASLCARNTERSIDLSIHSIFNAMYLSKAKDLHVTFKNKEDSEVVFDLILIKKYIEQNKNKGLSKEFCLYDSKDVRLHTVVGLFRGILSNYSEPAKVW